VNCDLTTRKLFEYLDGELTGQECGPLEEHIGACPDCQHRLELERAFREIYVAPLRPDPAPAAVRARAERLLTDLAASPQPGSARRFGRRALVAAVLAAGVLIIGALSTLMLTWTQREASASLLRLADASVEQHQKLARGLLPFDIARVSPKEAEQWFGQTLDFNVRLPELKDENLTFLGGRVSHLKDVEVAALEYQVDRKNVTLFIMPAEQYQKLGLKAEPKFKMVNRQGYDVIVWSSHGAAYALVSEIGGRSCTVCHSRDERLDVTLKPEVHRAR
jgi:anti-sigma factor (TIGR02949 family)